MVPVSSFLHSFFLPAKRQKRAPAQRVFKIKNRPRPRSKSPCNQESPGREELPPQETLKSRIAWQRRAPGRFLSAEIKNHVAQMDCCSPTRKLRSSTAFEAVWRRARTVCRPFPSKAVKSSFLHSFLLPAKRQKRAPAERVLKIKNRPRPRSKSPCNQELPGREELPPEETLKSRIAWQRRAPARFLSAEIKNHAAQMNCCSPTRKLRRSTAFEAVWRRARAVCRPFPNKAVNRLKRVPSSTFQMAKKKISQCIGRSPDVQESQDLPTAWDYSSEESLDDVCIEAVAVRDLLAGVAYQTEENTDDESQEAAGRTNIFGWTYYSSSDDESLYEELSDKEESSEPEAHPQEMLDDETQGGSYSLHVGREKLSHLTSHVFDESAVFPVAITFVDQWRSSNASIKSPTVWYPTMGEFATREAARKATEGIFRTACAARGRFSFRNTPGEIIEEAAAMMHTILPRPGGRSRYQDFLSLNFDLHVILRVIPGVESERPRGDKKTCLRRFIGKLCRRVLSPLHALVACFKNRLTGVSPCLLSKDRPWRPVILTCLLFLVALDIVCSVF